MPYRVFAARRKAAERRKRTGERTVVVVDRTANAPNLRDLAQRLRAVEDRNRERDNRP